jgi:hypothetical protein
MRRRIETFAEFWPFYLGEHSKPATRVLHLVGSTAALVCLGLAITLRAPALLAASALCGYGCAWIAHFAIERNRPASFRYPLWSFAADWKMWAYAVTGRLGREVRRVGLPR